MSKKINDKTSAIIVAAGNSKRIGTDKIFIQIINKPLISWTIEAFQESDMISEIVLVLNKNNIERGNQLRNEQNWTKVTKICTGGKRRQDSVKKGLDRLTNCKWVLIHDGARPFISSEEIKRGIIAARKTGAAIPGVPVKDTIKLSDENLIVKRTLDRNLIWVIQTPQIYRFDIISEAYDKCNDTVTDDSAMVEKLGYDVKIYMGSYKNIKITTQDDIIAANLIARDNIDK